MATRAKVDYRDVEELILFRLHLALAKRENFDSTPEHLAGELHIPPQLIRICADRLVADDLCRTRNVESFGEHPITGDDASYTETLIEVT